MGIFKGLTKGISKAWDRFTKPWQKAWDSFSGNEARRQMENLQRVNLQNAQTQLDFQKAALEEYLKYMREALGQQDSASRDAIAAQLLGAQISDITARQNALPYQAASLSALQALPVLQSMAGLSAYRLPTTLPAKAPDYLREYINARNVLEAALAPSANTYVWTDKSKNENVTMRWNPATKSWEEIGREPFSSGPYLPPPGIRANIRAYPDTPPTAPPAATTNALAGWTPQVEIAPGGEFKLEEFTPQYNFKESPLYQWQKNENTRLLRQGLAARGLLSSGAGAELENRMLSKLAAEESQNQYNRVMDLVKIGMGQAASAGNWQNQAATPLSFGAQLAGGLGDAARARASMYQGMGQAAQGAYSNMGSILGQAYGANNALAAQMAAMPSPWERLINLGLRIYGMSQGTPGIFGF